MCNFILLLAQKLISLFHGKENPSPIPKSKFTSFLKFRTKDIAQSNLTISISTIKIYEKEICISKKLTGSPDKGKQEVEAKKGELRSRLRLGDKVQEPNVWKQRNCKKL